MEIEETEREKFASWAFGEDYLKWSNPLLFMESWNSLHGDQLTLYPNGLIEDDAKAMQALWRASNGRP